MKRFVYLLLICVLCATMIFTVACGNENGSGNGGKPPIEDGNGGGKPPIDDENGSGEQPDEDKDEVIYASDYTPTTFAASSLTNSVTKLGDGVRMVKNSYTLSGKTGTVIVYATEIDLTKADIKAGCNQNNSSIAFASKQVPYQMMQAFEKDNPTSKVLLATNADFFGITSVNAFVKDGIIIKDSHNDNGNYDYKNAASDVPASAPMLFGINGSVAQIAPIKNYTGDIKSSAVKKEVIQSKLFYSGSFSGSEVKHRTQRNIAPANVTDSVVYLSQTSATYNCPSGSVVVKATLSANDPLKATVTEVMEITSTARLSPKEGNAYIVAPAGYENISAVKTANAGDVFSLSVASEDGTWDGFDTVIGCRQALVIDGKIADTVTVENSNGANNTNIPRTAVGIKEDGKVVLFSVEALTYGKFGSDEDSKGLSLPELADFIRYYDCTDSANFDGGGSTQVVIREGYNGSGAPKVVVRSSDTGSATLTSSRPVINAFLVTTKSK